MGKRKRDAEVLPDVLQMSDDINQLVTSLRDMLVNSPFFVEHWQITRALLEWQPDGRDGHVHVDMFRDKDDVLRPCAFVDLHCCYWLHQGIFAAPCGHDSYETKSRIMELTASSASRKSCIAVALCVTRLQSGQKVAISAGTMQAITSRRLFPTQGQQWRAAFHAELFWLLGFSAAIAAALAGTQATAASDTG